ncbi:hypothetical protein QGN29_11035 [Temperatibacter marinus]|uniref:Uncharacterized protein n=1 Tax=Temperatibacter marinus TaxID=1456591 RepID=A0AA52EGG1_9PROT|nr:hypothetical protein [Temperatibacter marinus]WND02082.1 hypothetical protein QGN29_11035 [Temperatibacter marinus]
MFENYRNLNAKAIVQKETLSELKAAHFTFSLLLPLLLLGAGRLIGP